MYLNMGYVDPGICSPPQKFKIFQKGHMSHIKGRISRYSTNLAYLSGLGQMQSGQYWSSRLVDLEVLKHIFKQIPWLTSIKKNDREFFLSNHGDDSLN